MIVVLIAIIVAVGLLVEVRCDVVLEEQLVSPSQPQPRIPIRTLAAATVTSGYYVVNVFSDIGCSLYVSQQTFLLNVCYPSSTSGQYNIGVLQLYYSTPNYPTFSSFTVTSTTSSASCSSLVTSGTNLPSSIYSNLPLSSYAGESCALLSTGFYYTSTWSAFPDIVPPVSTSSSALQSGSIIKWYGTDYYDILYRHTHIP